MNWTHFILLLTGVYFLYYGANIAADLLRASNSPAETEDRETLFFDDDIQPQLITYEEAPPPAAAPEVAPPKPEQPVNLPSPGVEYDGALSLRELIRAAQNNLIEFTGAIPY